MAELKDHGRFVWHDLLTTDPEAAAAFYARLFGWSIAPYEVPGITTLTIWTAGDVPVASPTRLVGEPWAVAAGLGPHWLGYIGVIDVDATVAEAERLGARVFAPAVDVPGIGRYAVLADPQGAVFAAFRPAEVLPDAPHPGRIDWCELATTDPRAAFGFYSALFGWVEMGAVVDPADETATALVVGRPRQPPLGVIRRMTLGEPHPMWLCCTSVDDVARVAEEAARSEGRVIAGPMDTLAGGRIVVCVDPQGVWFGAIQ